REHGAGFSIELENGVDRVVVAVDRTAAGRDRPAALVGPDVAVRGIDRDPGRRPPLASSRQLTPVPGHDWGGVRQPLAGDRIADLSRAPSIRRRGLRVRRSGLLGGEYTNSDDGN